MMIYRTCIDAHLQRQIMDKCIRGALKRKTVILVTHQIHFLEETDNIAIILEGKLRATGTLKELKDKGIQFSNEVDTSVEYESGDPTISKTSVKKS